VAVFSAFYTGAATFSFKQLFICTHEAEWIPFQTHYVSENLVAPGIEPGPLIDLKYVGWIYSCNIKLCVQILVHTGLFTSELLLLWLCIETWQSIIQGTMVYRYRFSSTVYRCTSHNYVPRVIFAVAHTALHLVRII
jgi:hypothetical protein